MFVYHDTFEQAMEQIDDLETNDQYNALILPGSIEEACLAFKCKPFVLLDILLFI